MTAMLLESAVEQGFIYALVALALYLSYRVLDIADLTTDGTFVLGSAVSAVFSAAGKPVLGLVLAFFAGCAAGFVTAFLHTRMKVQAILAGIITMTGLYTINLWTMGNRADLPLLKADTVFTRAAALLGSDWSKLIVCAAITSAVRLVDATVNDVLGLAASVKVHERSGSIEFRLPGGLSAAAESTCQSLLAGLMLYFTELHDEYPENIEVMEA